MKESRFGPGAWVRVRPFAEIRATLDPQGARAGLPFMPEMARYCGQRFPVFRRVEKTYLDRKNVVSRLQDIVLLAGLRCDGAAHGECQMGCALLWHEAWLQPAPEGDSAGSALDAPSPAELAALPTTSGEAYYCQATELSRCGEIIPWWDVRQYVRDLRARRMPLREWFGMLGLLAYNKLRRVFRLKEHGLVVGTLERTTNVALGLQPGELVEVKSRAEIEATLDRAGLNRGLGFSPEMVRFCGGRYRVLRRVERAILEWSGELRTLANTVVLDTVTCSGLARRGCPRDCHHLWRECWLKRVATSEARGASAQC